MKVRVYPQEDGNFTLLVEASPGKGRPPVIVKDVAKEDIGSTVLPLVDQMRRPKGEPTELSF